MSFFIAKKCILFRSSFVIKVKGGKGVAEQTLEQLYEEKAQLIFNYLRKLGCPREDAEDIVQVTFSKAIEQWIHIATEQPSAWLFRVAIHHYYDLYRHRRAFPHLQVDEILMERLLPGIAEEGEASVLKQEAQEEFRYILQQMNPAYAHILLLKYEAEYSYEEIGQLLQMKEDYVRTSLYRARKQFKQRWEEQQYERKRTI